MDPRVQKALRDAFASLPVYVRAVDGCYDIAVARSPDMCEAQCFDIFCRVSDDLVQDGVIDPTEDALIWYGAIDITSDFTRL